MITADRCREALITTGTGSLTLLGAVAGFQAFATPFVTGDLVDYCIVNGTEWEVGIGTFTSPSTLARTTIISSSNANAVVDLSAGTKEVFATLSSTAINGATRSTGIVTYNAAQTNPQNYNTPLATVTIPAKTLRVRDCLLWTAYVNFVLGTGTLSPRFQLLFGASTWMVEMTNFATTDTACVLYGELYVTGAATQVSMSRWGRQNGSFGNQAFGTGTEAISGAIAVAFGGRFNGANGTATLECVGFSLEIARAF